MTEPKSHRFVVKAGSRPERLAGKAEVQVAIAAEDLRVMAGGALHLLVPGGRGVLLHEVERMVQVDIAGGPLPFQGYRA